jgi:hypothetical protein
MDKAQRPNFLVLGAYKAGTTSLYHYLRQHPQIYLPTIKEVRFLTYAGHQMGTPTPADLLATTWPVTTLAAYEALYAEAQPQHSARGEVSPSYLAFPEQSILGIQQYAASAKLIALLRQPADRAYSSFVGLVKAGWEDVLDFRETLRLERARKPRCTNGSPRRNLVEGFYFAQLSHYYHTFSPDRILVCLYDEWQKNGVDLLRRIFRFLEVDPAFIPDQTRKYNQASWPRSQRLHHWLQQSPPAGLRWLSERWRLRLNARLNRLNLTSAPPLEPALRQQLTHIYREDILQLQDLIQQDLAHWLTT